MEKEVDKLLDEITVINRQLREAKRNKKRTLDIIHKQRAKRYEIMSLMRKIDESKEKNKEKKRRSINLIFVFFYFCFQITLLTEKHLTLICIDKYFLFINTLARKASDFVSLASISAEAYLSRSDT